MSGEVRFLFSPHRNPLNLTVSSRVFLLKMTEHLNEENTGSDVEDYAHAVPNGDDVTEGIEPASKSHKNRYKFPDRPTFELMAKLIEEDPRSTSAESQSNSRKVLKSRLQVVLISDMSGSTRILVSGSGRTQSGPN